MTACPETEELRGRARALGEVLELLRRDAVTIPGVDLRTAERELAESMGLLASDDEAQASQAVRQLVATRLRVMAVAIDRALAVGDARSTDGGRTVALRARLAGLLDGSGV